ncbi:MAG: response regulator [Geobacteraceae bacterium]|nr:response regulator [Geobacteraceae bacterium]
MNHSKPRILCVDDEHLNLSLLDAMLTPRGYDVIAAVNGPQALEKIRTERIDICLLDVMMPGMDGFEVCRRIKSDELHANIPVVMITAFADTEHRIRGIEAGAEDFISKPFDAAEVLARIKMLLHVKGLNDRLNSACHDIAKLSAFGEQIIINFDPANFDFQEKIDSIVQQIIRSRFDLKDSPQIVVIGMVDQAGSSHWLRYDSSRAATEKSAISMDLDRRLAFSDNALPIVVYYNETDAELAASTLVGELKKQSIPVFNLVRYSNDSFCLIALNYGREVTPLDATVLNSVVMQSLFLKSLASQVRDTESAFEYTVFALARASEANDEETGDHILRVGTYCALLAGQLGLPEKFVQMIRIQAALHDVGKIHVSPAILKKNAKLTDDEWQEMKMHTVHGSEIIGGHHRMGMAARIALSHHERFDGSGYPYGLSGEQIPLEGRILSLADQYDALRNARCYKPAFDHETTCRIILEGDGRSMPQHFDPAVLRAFRMLERQFAEGYETLIRQKSWSRPLNVPPGQTAGLPGGNGVLRHAAN